jgi:hypothetical protein
MLVQQIPCSQTSTSSLVANLGLSGLGAPRFQAPSGVLRPRPVPVPLYPVRSMRSFAGMGCPNCPNGLNGGRGLGDGLTFDGTGLFGTGLFSGGMDFANWTVWEYATLAVGAYVLMSVFHTTKTVARTTRRKVRAVAKA